MPTAIFIAQPTDTPRMLRDVGLARSVNRAHDVWARGLPQFPVTLIRKPELNFAAFCQPSLPAQILRDRCRYLGDTHCERSHHQLENPVKIRCWGAAQ
jgi:hypothetical protein